MNKWLYGSWGLLYIVTVALGLIQDAAGAGKILLLLCGILFFVPAFWLLWRHIQADDRKGILRLRLISLASLVLTLVAIIVFFLAAAQEAGTFYSVMYDILNLVSAPMLCCQYWAVSLFFWACLLFGSFLKKDR